MLLALVTFASEAAGEESSQAAFYIGGLLLAAFAVVVGVLGIMRPGGFVANAGTRTAVVALAALLMAGACATAVLSS